MPYQQLQPTTIRAAATTSSAIVKAKAKAKDRQYWQHFSARLMTKWLFNQTLLFDSLCCILNASNSIHKAGLYDGNAEKNSLFYWFGRIKVWHGMKCHCAFIIIIIIIIIIIKMNMKFLSHFIIYNFNTKKLLCEIV